MKFYFLGMCLAALSIVFPARNLAQEMRPAGSESSPQAQSPAIRLGVGDQIDMTVFNVPEMTQRQRVDENGNYAVPLIGPVHVEGLTVQQAQSLISTKLEKGYYVKSASVSLLISDFATQSVSVLGEVTKPGIYPVWGDRHLLDLIAEAGGLSPRAGKSATVTHRDTATTSEVIDFAKSDPTDLRTNPMIRAGDTITIGKTGVVYVLGEVGRPGGFPLDSQQGLTLLQAIALAEGTTRTAKVGSARLIRQTSHGRVELPVSLKQIVKGKEADTVLQNDDILYVPNSAVKTVADRTVPQIVAATTSAVVYTGLR